MGQAFKTYLRIYSPVSMVFMLFSACRPDPILPPAPQSIKVEATVPARIYTNIKKVILDASLTRSLNGNRPLFFSWACIGFPAVNGNPEIRFKEEATAYVENLKIGEYKFQLTVKDNFGNNSVSIYQLEVLLDSIPKNIPVAKAGPDQQITAPLHSVELDGYETIANNAPGRPLNYHWTVIMKPVVSHEVVLSNSINITSMADNLVEGLYKFQLEVINEYGAAAFDTVEVQVMPDPLKGTTRLFEDLKWQLQGNDEWGYAILLILNDPDLFINRFSGNMEIKVWDEEKNEWFAADKYYWYTRPSGDLYIELILDGEYASYIKMNGVKTKVQVKIL